LSGFDSYYFFAISSRRFILNLNKPFVSIISSTSDPFSQTSSRTDLAIFPEIVLSDILSINFPKFSGDKFDSSISILSLFNKALTSPTSHLATSFASLF
jgi:hypothetical protein